MPNLPPHLTTIAGLSALQLQTLLDKAHSFLPPEGRFIHTDTLARKKVATLFFEPSTRTRLSFELAAKQLSAEVLSVDTANSSTQKGESLLDTVRTLQALQCDIAVIRHPQSGSAHFIGQQSSSPIVINAGDGWHAHPTQTLTDLLTIRKRLGPDFSKRRVAIVGDIRHSRVARSLCEALSRLEVQEIRAIAPKTLLPPTLAPWRVRVFHDLETGLTDVDVIVMLRLQTERMQAGLIPPHPAYFREWGLTPKRLATFSSQAIILHPGPIHWGVEMHPDLLENPQLTISEQVTHGVAARMAVLSLWSAREANA